MPAVATPDATPYKAVCVLLCYEKWGTLPWLGTGALIGGNPATEGAYVLTCAHNLVDRDKKGGRRSASHIYVFPHFSVENQLPALLDGLPVAHGFYPGRWGAQFRNALNWDIAILQLGIPRQGRRAAAHYEHNDYMRPTVVEYGEAPPEVPLALVGYPENHLVLMWEEQERWTRSDVWKHMLFYSHNVKPGTSGAPVYRYVKGKAPSQYAVHGYEGKQPIRNPEDSNGGVGVLITRETYDFIQRAIIISKTVKLNDEELLYAIPPD